MEITYIGHSCFRIKGKDITIIIDPYDSDLTGYKMPIQKTDIVLCSHSHADHSNLSAVKEYRVVFDTPGEFEVSDVYINGYKTFHDSKKGEDRGSNTIFHIEIDGFNVLHLGDLGHELDKDTLEKLPEVDVLLIPVGGVYTIDAATAAGVISSIEPRLVVPMHYQTGDLDPKIKLDALDKFLEEMGVEHTYDKEDVLKLKAATDLPEETKILVLTPQH